MKYHLRAVSKILFHIIYYVKYPLSWKNKNEFFKYSSLHFIAEQEENKKYYDRHFILAQ